MNQERVLTAIIPARDPSLRLHSNGNTEEAPRAMAAGDRNQSEVGFTDLILWNR